ncbi:MAG TPA: VWA domain-containing protein, partial [Pyrinomonadaceae bacterium]|nr:VWA domain-containing protein [Pyrinomonadaceae bacterium]
MKKIIFALIFSFFSILTISAQNPTPTPPDDEDGVVKISTTLIQIDVGVTDKDGKQITDLKAEDFEILENGEKQEITNFSYIAVTQDAKNQAQEQVTVNSKQVKIPPVPTNLRADQVRRTIVLVVDDIGMSIGSMANVREALKKFVNEQMQEGDLVAIIRTSAGISVFQQFTSDKRILRAAIEKVKWNGLTGTMGIFEPLRPTTKDLLNGQVNSSGESRQTQGNEQDKQFEKDAQQMRQGMFAAGTLGALRYVVKGMSEMPGRKAIMVFSDGWDMFEGTIREKNASAAMVQQAMDNLVESANRAGVIINTIDARGLAVPGMFTAEDDTLGQSLEQLEEIQKGRLDDFRNSQSGLAYLADRTGGRVFLNQNNLSRGVEKALNDQSGYYLIAYQPDSDSFDATKRRFNKLTVRVKRDGAKVRYRSGFFGVTDEKLNPNKQIAQTPQQRMSDALFSPFGASGIAMRMTSIFANDIKEGNFVRAFLHLDGKSLTFAEGENGNKKLSFEVIGFTFDENGKIADSFGKLYSIAVKAENVQKLVEKGLVYSMLVPIKKAGAYQLRVAIRDVTSDKIGAATQFIEIPNLDKNRLSLSGLVLQNMTAEQWQARVNGQTVSDMQDAPTVTATRIFRRGTVLLFNYVIYNAKPDANRNVQIQTQARLYRDGELVFEGKIQPLNAQGQTDLKRLEGNGAVRLGKNLVPGDYV